MKPETLEAIKEICEPLESFTPHKKDFEAGMMNLLDHPEILALEGYHKTEWVSVEDRLPTKEDADENGKVLIFRKTNEGQTGLSKSIYDYDMVKYCSIDTYWQRLPPSPKQ